MERPEPERKVDGVHAGPAGSALARQMDAAYTELRELAGKYLRRERAGHTLEPTALVHSVFLRLVDASVVERADRVHFVALAAGVMRRVLVDHARARGAAKRGGAGKRVTMHSAVGAGGADATGGTIDVLALDEALTRLAAMDERQARMVELRFFGGLTVEEVAAQMGVSKRTVESEWTTARAWLHRALSVGA